MNHPSMVQKSSGLFVPVDSFGHEYTRSNPLDVRLGNRYTDFVPTRSQIESLVAEGRVFVASTPQNTPAATVWIGAGIYKPATVNVDIVVLRMEAIGGGGNILWAMYNTTGTGLNLPAGVDMTLTTLRGGQLNNSSALAPVTNHYLQYQNADTGAASFTGWTYVKNMYSAGVGNTDLLGGIPRILPSGVADGIAVSSHVVTTNLWEINIYWAELDTLVQYS